jgi:hypothetical protein
MSCVSSVKQELNFKYYLDKLQCLKWVTGIPIQSDTTPLTRLSSTTASWRYGPIAVLDLSAFTFRALWMVRSSQANKNKKFWEELIAYFP